MSFNFALILKRNITKKILTKCDFVEFLKQQNTCRNMGKLCFDHKKLNQHLFYNHLHQLLTSGRLDMHDL